MAVNKVEYGGETLIDLTSDSVTPQTLAEGETAHNGAGEEITGTLKVQDEIVVTTGSSTAYEATVRGITELKAGVNFIMIPHETSSYNAPTLNVNELGAKSIRRKTSDGKVNATVSVFNFFTKDKPYRLMYDGAYWMVVDYSKPSATDLDGSVPINKIATSSTNAGKVITTNDNGVAEWQEPSVGGIGNMLSTIVTFEGAVQDLFPNECGIDWLQSFGLYDEDDNLLKDGTIVQRIPIVAGEGINFEPDGEVVRINATGGGSGGNTLKPSEGLEYEPYFEGESFAVSGIGTCTDDFVIIPSEYEGLPVRSINDGAFYGSSITKVFIPKSITGGIYDPFLGCNYLTTVYCEAETQPDSWYPDWQDSLGSNVTVVWGYKLEGEDDNTSAMPTIRFSNAFDNNGSWIIDESNAINFTVEVMSGKVQEGDLLQICVRRMYKKNDRKIWRLRMVETKELSSEDIGQQFLSISAFGGELAERWLFKNDRNSNRSDTKSSIYLRIKRVTKYNSDGVECNAIFSNIVEINKTFNHSTFKVTIK